MDSTKQLQEKIKLMKLYQAEDDFQRLKGLFTQTDLDVAAIVETYKEEYDSAFHFTGEATNLFEAIEQHLMTNGFVTHLSPETLERLSSNELSYV